MIVTSVTPATEAMEGKATSIASPPANAVSTIARLSR